MHLLKNILRAWVGFSFIMLSVTVAATSAAPPATTWESSSFQATVRGTSTLHDWSVESTIVTGNFHVTAGTVTGSLRLPATSLSGGPKGLNEKMHAALKAETHPTILFEASEVAWPSGAPAAGAAQEWPVHGWLTLAGTRRELPLSCHVTQQPDGQLSIVTTVDLKLTDFGIKPPTFMGVVRTGDAVNVQIRWVLRPPADPVAAR